MARPLRIEFAGALYHVMARGNDRERIYRDNVDRQAFLDGLVRACERFDWLLWAYCLLGNHYHLLVETRRPTLSQGMREVNGVYTQAYNRRHRRVGHVLQGRYKAILVDKDAYLLEMSRYIVLNPVRAGLCASVGKWRWSSYRAVIGMTEPQAHLAVKETLELFGEDPGRARVAYASFVAAGLETAVAIEGPVNQIILGDEHFVAETTRRLQSLSPEIPRRQRAQRSLASIAEDTRDRDAAIRAAYATGVFTLKAIGEQFGLHYTTVSRIARAADV